VVTKLPRLLIAESHGLSSKALADLHEWADVSITELETTGIRQALLENDIVWIRLSHRVTAGDLAGNVRCRLIACPATGLDHIDVQRCVEARIAVAGLKGESDFLRDVRATAELTIGLLLALVRRIPEAVDSVKQGYWDRNRFSGTELYGKRVGVVGVGRLGTIVAGYFRAFGMKVHGYDPNVTFDPSVALRCESLDELFRMCDIVSLHVSYDRSTHHLVDDRLLANCKPGLILLNTSRGGVVDSGALLEMLKSGRVAGVGLDVLEGEPEFLDGGRALIAHAAVNANVLVTPHLGGNTRESCEKTEQFLARKVRKTWEEIVRQL
jgi:D-3-phosphoglycerate dehydrogenase